MKTNLKKSLAVLLCIIFAFSAFGICSFAADDVITYAVNDEGNAFVQSCAKSAKGTVVVSAVVVIGDKTYDVKNVGENAFAGCTGITEISLPEGVRTIGSKAFSDCTALKTVDIPSTLVSCEYDAFDGCNMLTVNCYKSNYQFFAVYGFADNIQVNIIDGDLGGVEGTKTFNSIVDLIRNLILKILALFGIVKA